MLIAAIRYEPPQHLAPFSGRPGPLERLAAIAAEQTLGCVPELPTIPRDTLAVLQEGCRRISDVADPRAHGGVLQPLLSLVASTATHMLVCRASRSDFGASEDILLRPLELAHSILETQLE